MELIVKFLNEVELNNSFDFLETKKFIEYNNFKDSKKEDVVSLLINENIKLLRRDLNNQKPYRVLTHQQAFRNGIELNFTFSDYSKVYHVVTDNNDIITTIVFGSKKIISFSYNIIKNIDKPKTPFLLNNL